MLMMAVHNADSVVAKVTVHPSAIANENPDMHVVKGDDVSGLQFALVNVLEAGYVLNE